jgi:transposase
MQKLIKSATQLEKPMDKPSITIGIDLGDRFSHYCMVNREGDEVERGRMPTTEAALRRHFEGEPRMRVAVECGTHSAWISRLLEQLGHQVLVANTRKLRAITSSESKNDGNDAEKLARFAACDPRLLSPIRHRSGERQRDLDLVHSRGTLVRARTMIVNSLRGLVKSAGGRLPACSTASFRSRAQASVPATLTAAATPLLEQVEALNRNIAEMDRTIEQLAARYPEIELLRSAPGVGPVVAATYVLTLDSKDKVRHSRQAGAFLGLRPRQSQSGDSDPQNRIAKTGNVYLRSLLVQAAHYVLGRFGPDSELRRWGLKLAASGGKRGKKRAIVAVARKLAVILHRMWQTGDRWQAFPQAAGKSARIA